MRPTGLPSEYQEVEWIQWINTKSNYIATVYIDTWVTVNNNIWCSAEMLHTATRNDVQRFTNTNNRYEYINNRRGITTYPSWMWCVQWDTWHSTNVSNSIDNWYDIKLNRYNDKKVLINWSQIYSLWSEKFTENTTIWIWDITYKGYWWKCKSFKITDWIDLIRDFIPCYRKLDWVIGMYDLVNWQFYVNSWTESFTKGPDV